MRKIFLTAITIAAAIGAYAAADPKPAFCVYCTPAPCFGESQCNAGCQCLSTGDGTPGTCVQLR